jgi:DNA polymerase-3 subunit alpha
MTRNVGMHAGGVLIAPGKLTDFTPLYQQPGSDSAVSQYDKDDVEAAGLVKFDFLGLATLTILEIAREFIARATRPGRTSRSRTSRSTTRHLQAVLRRQDRGGVPVRIARHAGHVARRPADAAGRPDRAERAVPPGPDGPDPQLRGAQARPREVEYPHPLVAEMLSETYGIMVYQEQVMQTAQILGGYSLGGADLLRRAMGKKKAEEMAEHRETFRAGAAKNGIPQEKADEIFDLMEKFAGYGFNKSHAAAYSLLAYHTGWLKVHLHGGVLLREHDRGNGQHRQAEGAVRGRGEELRHDLRAAGREPRHLPLRAGLGQGHPLRAGRRQGHGPAGHRGHRAPRGKRAARSPACSTSACASTARASTSARSRR